MRFSDHKAALSLHREIVPYRTDEIARNERSKLTRVGFQVDQVEMRVGAQDSSGASNLHDFGDILSFNPDPHRKLLSLLLCQAGYLDPEGLWL